MLEGSGIPGGKIKPQFLARELAVLAFNQRVLAQAQDRRVPALERLRFLCILSSNLDEFFEIRVAELKERIRLGNEIAIPGETPSAEVFPLVSGRTHTLVAEQYRLLNKEIFPELADESVRFLAEHDWTKEQRSWLHNYFMKEMIPLLTPIGLDPSHPFPRVLNKSLNFAVQLEGRDAFGRNSGTAIVQAPRALPRAVHLRRLMQIPDLVAAPKLKFPAFVPGLPKQLEKSPDLFRAIRKGDVLLHHPFQSFGPVIDFLEPAVEDPSVVVIKQTVYRTGTDSVLMQY